MEEPPKKICAICGKDCSKQRRVKDNKGRYYHKECLQRARQEEAEDSEQGDERLGSVAVIAPPPEEKRGGEYAVADPSSGDFAPPAGPTEIAPRDNIDQYGVERDDLPPSDDFSDFGGGAGGPATGPAVSTRIAAVPTHYAGEGGRLWPAVVGVISILAGLGEAVWFGLDPVRKLIAGEFRLLPVIIAGLAVLLGLWLVVGGIGVLTRQQTAMGWIQRWAKLKIAFSVLLVGGIVAAVIMDLSLLDQFDSQLINEAKDKTIGSLITSGVLYLLPLLIWPLFALFWFGRKKTLKDVGFWR